MGLREVLDRIFTPVEEVKASRAARFVAMQTQGRPVWTPRDYGALVREGYLKNPIAYRAIRMISEAAASLPLVVKEGAHEVHAHPVLDLLAKPAPGEDASGFLETVFGHLLVSGNAYIEAVELEGSLRELHTLRPDRVKVVPGPKGWVEAYDYTVGGKTIRITQGSGVQVAILLHLKQFHPLNDYYGFAALEAAQGPLDIHNAAASWSKGLLDNAACPSGALVYGSSGEAMHLTDEQFTRLKDELSDNYQGARNAGRPLLLEGGLDWKPMAHSPKDMDFIAAKNQAAREIALALGVPPLLLGLPGDNTYANYQEANRAFWRQTVIPLAKKVHGALSAWLSPAYEQPFILEADLDGVDALSAERSALWDRVSSADFLTEDEKRLAVGYGVKEER
ncbi:phage portal protein [Pseudovibrio exalbescens]|uniref:phage portal protein n=1 Tax=Pseudovibrio exalbescens TaxID=197461 RepID=UPI0023663FC0|nr:phage portal protein [Pseudovibrio exalbescens]MDD7909149.1 phage portal protein [Pseudovibrio exalbescens]